MTAEKKNNIILLITLGLKIQAKLNIINIDMYNQNNLIIQRFFLNYDKIYHTTFFILMPELSLNEKYNNMPQNLKLPLFDIFKNPQSYINLVEFNMTCNESVAKLLEFHKKDPVEFYQNQQIVSQELISTFNDII